MSANASVEWREVGDVAVATVVGDLDVSCEQDVQEALLAGWERASGRLVADLSAVTFIDVRGLHVLMSLVEQVAADKGALAVATPPAALHRMVELLGMADAPPMYASLEEALAEVSDGTG